MRNVYVAGIGMTRFAKQLGRSLKDLTAEAVTAALKDAGQTAGDVQACYFGNAVAGSMTGQEMLVGQFGLRPLGVGEIPVFNVENACASASTAFHLAWQAVATGVHDAVLDGTRLRGEVDNAALTEVLRRLSAIGVRTLTCRPPTLEELFLRHYSGQDQDHPERVQVSPVQ